MPRYKIVLLSGKTCESEMKTDVLYFIYGEFKARRMGSVSPILIEIFDEGKRGYVDLRKIDPDATFTPSVSSREPIAA